MQYSISDAVLDFKNYPLWILPFYKFPFDFVIARHEAIFTETIVSITKIASYLAMTT